MHPRKLRNAFADHDCMTIPEAGFAGQKNGQLLSSAERAGFELFFTIDKGLQYQQNLSGRRIAILIVRSRSSRLQDLLNLAETWRSAMNSIQPGQVIRIG